MSENNSNFKWIPYEYGKSMPENPKTSLDVKEYLVCTLTGDIRTINILVWSDGWNCSLNFDGTICRSYEIKDVIAWAELPEPYVENNTELEGDENNE